MYIRFIKNQMTFQFSYFFSSILSKIRNCAFCNWSGCLKIINESQWLQVFIKKPMLSTGAPVIINVRSKMSSYRSSTSTT